MPKNRPRVPPERNKVHLSVYLFKLTWKKRGKNDPFLPANKAPKVDLHTSTKVEESAPPALLVPPNLEPKKPIINLFENPDFKTSRDRREARPSCHRSADSPPRVKQNRTEPNRTRDGNRVEQTRYIYREQVLVSTEYAHLMDVLTLSIVDGP
jgi:hypothetical protein